jgi:hypothetical protein
MEELRAASKGPSDPGPFKRLAAVLYRVAWQQIISDRRDRALRAAAAPTNHRAMGISGGETFVAVVQSTHLREHDNLAWFCQMDRAGIGAILFSERCVRVRW